MKKISCAIKKKKTLKMFQEIIEQIKIETFFAVKSNSNGASTFSFELS